MHDMPFTHAFDVFAILIGLLVFAVLMILLLVLRIITLAYEQGTPEEQERIKDNVRNVMRSYLGNADLRASRKLTKHALKIAKDVADGNMMADTQTLLDLTRASQQYKDSWATEATARNLRTVAEAANGVLMTPGDLAAHNKAVRDREEAIRLDALQTNNTQAAEREEIRTGYDLGRFKAEAAERERANLYRRLANYTLEREGYLNSNSPEIVKKAMLQRIDHDIELVQRQIDALVKQDNTA